MDPILLNDFRAQWSRVRAAVLEAVDRVGASGWLILGSEVDTFERELAQYWGLPFCVGCGSGQDALEMCLRCAGLEPGDKVLTTPLSAFATSLAIIRAGGVPVFVDVDDSGHIDLDLSAQILELQPDLRFMLPVHLYGHAIDLRRLEALRDRFSLHIVEDCAQSVGALSHKVAVGTVGEFAATSFYPTKNLGCMGDGGAVFARSEETAQRVRDLRDYGQTQKYEHRNLGLNSRLDEIQAAILRDAFLPDLRRLTRRRAEIAARYNREIRNPEISPPPAPEGSQSVWHLYPVLVSEARTQFREHLERAGVATGVHYPKLIPDQRALEELEGASALTPLARARDFSTREVSLPIHPLLSDDDVGRVVEACNSWRR